MKNISDGFKLNAKQIGEVMLSKSGQRVIATGAMWGACYNSIVEHMTGGFEKAIKPAISGALTGSAVGFVIAFDAVAKPRRVLSSNLVSIGIVVVFSQCTHLLLEANKRRINANRPNDWIDPNDQ